MILVYYTILYSSMAGNISQQVKGQEEALGLRLIIGEVLSVPDLQVLTRGVARGLRFGLFEGSFKEEIGPCKEYGVLYGQYSAWGVLEFSNMGFPLKYPQIPYDA